MWYGEENILLFIKQSLYLFKYVLKGTVELKIYYKLQRDNEVLIFLPSLPTSK